MATAAAGADAPKGGGNKKLIIILAAVLVLVLGGGAALLLMKKKASVEDEEGADAAPAATHATAKKDGKPPVFVPLDPFTVNLTDKEVDRFAQVGVTLEVGDEHTAEEIKKYLPAIRSNVLMVLSHKSSAELLSIEGKEKLAREIMRESVRPLGIELDDEEEETPAAADGSKKKKKKKRRNVESPVSNVLFSQFIVQ